MKLTYYLEEDLLNQETFIALMALEFPRLRIRAFQTLKALASALDGLAPDLVISDLRVSDADSAAVLNVLNLKTPTTTPIVVMSGDASAMRRIRHNPRFNLHVKGDATHLLINLLSKVQARGQ